MKFWMYCWIFFNWKKAVSFNVFFVLWFDWVPHFYISAVIYNPMISVTFTLSSISSGFLLWPVNHVSTNENYVFVLFDIVDEWGDIFINLPNYLFGTNMNNTLETYWLLLLAKLQCTLKQLQLILILVPLRRLCLDWRFWGPF